MIRYIQSIGKPAFDETGKLIEYVGTIVDVTESKLAEEALRHARRTCTCDTGKHDGELTASIAHEVNQPLGAIVTNGNAFLHLLSRDKPDLAGAREAVECMVSDSMRASEVIRRIRRLLKKRSPETAPLNMNETIRDVIALAGNELERSQVSLRTELDSDLPPALGDRVQLQQVILNLILNRCSQHGNE